MTSQINILNVDLISLQNWCENNNIKPMIAKQVFTWIYAKQTLNPERYTDISPITRNLLKSSFRWDLPTIVEHLFSKDGSQKVLLELSDNNFIECVLMPNDNRATLCISSQIGCKMGCNFCQTGRMGFIRNLTAGEIIAQVMLASKLLENFKITNIVFMGMGEPLDNYEQVIQACKLLLAKNYFGLSKHRVTISTVGITEKIRQMGNEFPLRLAISLHTADNSQRSSMIPYNIKSSLPELKHALLMYPSGRDGITFEYIMLNGVNDTIEHAKKLVKYLHGLKAKVNLIPANPGRNQDYLPSTPDNIRKFQLYLAERSIAAPVRYSRGQDILGACGQLAIARKDISNACNTTTRIE